MLKITTLKNYGERTRSLALLVLILSLLFSGVVSAQQKPVTGYAPVNGLKMYYEVRGSGEPVLLLHGAFMAISGEWEELVAELSKKHKVIAVEMQGHGRTADIDRDITPEGLADDAAAVLDHLKIERADVVGYSLGGETAIACAMRHPKKVRKAVIISAPFRSTGWVDGSFDMWPTLTWEIFKGTPTETEWRKLNPNPDGFPDFFEHVKAAAMKKFDLGADNFKATKAPMLLIFGDADGVKLDHIAEMYSLNGGGVHGDIQPRPESRLAVIPNATHVTLMNRLFEIVPMINDFLDAKPNTK